MDREPPDRQRARDTAIVLPFAATILLTPPLIGLFAGSTTPGGFPLIVLYVFAAWAVIILSAFVLARRLPPPASDAPSDAPPDGGGTN